jgi:hypothetical protein
MVKRETNDVIELVTNLLTPDSTITIQKSEIELRLESKISSMPNGIVNILTKDEILALVGFLESDGYQLPLHLLDRHGHQHSK